MDVKFSSTADVAVGTTNNTWYNPTGHELLLPSAGKWEVEYKCAVYIMLNTATASHLILKATLDTTAAAENDPELTDIFEFELLSAKMANIGHCFHGRKRITISTPDIYYLNILGYNVGGTINALGTYGSQATTTITAERVR